MNTIRITSAKPIQPGPRYVVTLDCPDGTSRPIRLAYNSFRLVLILAIRALRDGGNWVLVSELADSNTGRYLYRLRCDLGLVESPILNNGRRGGYRWNSEAIAVQITQQAWAEIAEFPDTAVSDLSISGDDPEADARRAYQRNYYLVNREKYLEYQKIYRRVHARRANAPFEQKRLGLLEEVHMGHVQHATGGRLTRLIEDIFAGRRTYMGGV